MWKPTISNIMNGLTQAYFLSSLWQIKYKAHVLKTRNNYKLVTDTPVYVQAVKSGKQLSDVSAQWRSYFRESETGHRASGSGKSQRQGRPGRFSMGDQCWCLRKYWRFFSDFLKPDVSISFLGGIVSNPSLWNPWCFRASQVAFCILVSGAMVYASWPQLSNSFSAHCDKGRCPGGGHGNPLQYSCLENPMDGP